MAGTWDEWFEAFLDGTAPVPMAAGGENSCDWFGHTLGWWAAARANPTQVLWVRYEALLASPLEQVRAVARLVAPAAVDDEALLARIVRAFERSASGSSSQPAATVISARQALCSAAVTECTAGGAAIPRPAQTAPKIAPAMR